ncbi:MAG: OmpA family protein, partial [Flavisolibacter sp.]
PDLAKNRKVEIVASIPIPAAISSDNKIINSFNLDNIYFLPDRAIVTDESIPYINELANRLKTYKTEYFEIIGHVNYQSKKDSSQLQDLYLLSERRAKKIYDMLIEKGIPSSRMTYKGVGNSQPIYPNPINEDEKRKNMRLEVIILKE